MKRPLLYVLIAGLSACASSPTEPLPDYSGFPDLSQQPGQGAPGSNDPLPAESPSASASLVREGRALLASGNPVQAAAVIERALRIEPANPYLWIELGTVRLAENNHSQAFALGHKAMRLAGTDSTAREAAQNLIDRANRR